MDNQKFIIDNFSKLNILEMTQFLNITYYEYCDIVFEHKLYLQNTSNIPRYWKIEEDEIIQKYSSVLNIRHISNMLWRSYYATYQRVRYLGLHNLINKRGKK
ncbi:hypothetical protein [Staphylococcus sp. NRL 18/288]|uniref:hypothetical protein n=1 Tax=Staphylococcus caprae TaxID=29380 RepID=UPI001FB3B84F|nr:hypothetical protein [Staphylococcus sp. NRL 18/288]MCJ1663066.1 hypothetical protein [Staphylococcus sp. NRL 18/288]